MGVSCMRACPVRQLAGGEKRTSMNSHLHKVQVGLRLKQCVRDGLNAGRAGVVQTLLFLRHGGLAQARTCQQVRRRCHCQGTEMQRTQGGRNAPLLLLR